MLHVLVMSQIYYCLFRYLIIWYERCIVDTNYDLINSSCNNSACGNCCFIINNINNSIRSIEISSVFTWCRRFVLNCSSSFPFKHYSLGTKDIIWYVVECPFRAHSLVFTVIGSHFRAHSLVCIVIGSHFGAHSLVFTVIGSHFKAHSLAFTVIGSYFKAH